MKISSNLLQASTYNAPKAKNNGNFNEVVNEKIKANSSKNDEIIIGAGNAALGGDVRAFALNINDAPVVICDAINKLSDDQISALNLKYDINTIIPFSTEYDSLVQDLSDMGILSQLPYSMPPGVLGMGFDDAGNVTSYLVKLEDYSKAHNLIDNLDITLEQSKSKYAALLSQNVLTWEERIFANLYTSQENVKNAIEQIFASQIKDKAI